MKNRIRYKKLKENKKLKLAAKITTYIVVPLIIILMLLTTISNTLLDSEFHKKNFLEVNVYERVVQESVPSIINNIDKEEDTFLSQLLRKGFIYAFQTIVTPQWLQSETEIVIDDIINILTTKSDPNEIIILFEYLRRDYISNFFNQFPDKIPACDQENAGFLFAIIGCGGYNESIDHINNEIAISINYLTKEEEKINDSIYVLEGIVKEAYFIKNILASIPLYSIILLIMIIGGLFIIGWGSYPDVRKMIRKILIPISIASFISMLIGQILIFVSGWYIGNIEITFNPIIESMILELLNLSMKNTFIYLRNFSLILLLITLVTWVGQYAYDKINLKKQNYNKKI